MARTPSILIVLLNFRTPDLTLQAASAALREMDGLNAQMIILDNNSEDGSFELLTDEARSRGWMARDQVRVVSSPKNGGFGAGSNAAIRMGMADGSRPNYVYLLNSDAFVDPGAIRHLLDFMEATPRAGFAGSHIRGTDDQLHITHFRFPTIAGEFEQAAKLGPVTRLLRDATIPLPPSENTIRVDWVAGASVLIRRDALDEIGLFDEAYFLYYEETDLCLRARRAGWQTWYVPDSRVVHIGSVSTGMKTWRRTPSYWFASRDHYFRKNHGRLYLAAANLARISGGLLWRARRVISRRPLGEPPHFLSDFILHTARTAFSGTHMRRSAVPAQTLAKDSK